MLPWLIMKFMNSPPSINFIHFSPLTLQKLLSTSPISISKHFFAMTSVFLSFSTSSLQNKCLSRFRKKANLFINAGKIITFTLQMRERILEKCVPRWNSQYFDEKIVGYLWRCEKRCRIKSKPTREEVKVNEEKNMIVRGKGCKVDEEQTIQGVWNKY